MVPVSADLFRRACSQFATGICVVTAFDGRPHGITINSFTSVSLRPPIVLCCLDRETNLTEIFRRQHHFALNILSAEQQQLSTTFAFKPDDRFDGVAWRKGAHGTPILDGALAVLECRLIRVLPVGDHDVLFGETLQVQFDTTPDPLLYFRARYGHIDSGNRH